MSDTAPLNDRPHVLLIDDERQIHRFLRPTLEAAGYEAGRAETAAEALRQAAAQPPALILLDLGLPDLDGQDLLRRLREFTTAPIIVLSARDRPQEKIKALDAGANDYVEKPFDVGELLARIRAALRVLQALPPAFVFRSGVLEVDLARRQVQVAGQPVSLTPREYDLLCLMVRNAGRVITHKQLLTSVWGPAHTGDVQYLRVYVGHVRQKLGAEAGARLMTEPGVGYRLLEDKPGD
jgi:two-component system KDP operon response regulator KdpE